MKNRNIQQAASNSQQVSSYRDAAEKLKTHQLRPSTASNKSNKSIHLDRHEMRKSYGKLNFSHLGYNDEDNQKVVIQSLGRYIAKTLQSGRGVSIPKLGQFTFTSVAVDLKGATNPQIRDSQERFPVFLIGKDFPCSVTLQQGISSGMTTELFGQDGQHKNQTNHIRVYGNQGQSGIIPKVLISYFDIAQGTEGRVSKNDCRILIDSFVRKFADKVNEGKNIDEQIPSIGRLVIKNNIAAVVFNRSILETTRFQTAKKYDSIFEKNNWMNNKILEPNKAMLGKSAASYQNFEPLQTRLQTEDNGLVRRNLDIETKNDYMNLIENGTGDKTAPTTPEPYGGGNRSRKSLNKRAMSAFSTDRLSHKSLTRFSQPSTFLSRVPELAPFQLMNYANEIFNQRSAIVNFVQNCQSKCTMRDVLTVSQIHKILLKVGYVIMINNLKALVKDLGFEWNGKSISMMQLINALKNYINPEQKSRNLDAESNQLPKFNQLVATESAQIMSLKKSDGNYSIIEIIQDLFYCSGMTIFQLFRQGTASPTMGLEDFLNLISSVSNGIIPKEELTNVYDRILAANGKKRSNRGEITYKEFEDVFTHIIPRLGSQKFETLAIKKVREWMFNKQYNTKTAFERLCRSADRFKQFSLKRIDFHRAVIINRLPISAPEIDFLFDTLTGGEGDLTFEHWQYKIYDDNTNPLQIIRETIHSQKLDIDDVLFQMKIKIWDEPMDFVKFQQCLRRLDPSFSDSQCKSLFGKLKTIADKVEVAVFLNNICGSTQDTVDYKNKMFKILYADIFQQNKQDQLLNEFEQNDKLNDGKVSPQDLKKILIKMSHSKYKDEDLVKFIRQLKKDDGFKINYQEFMERIILIGNKEHNPFKSLMHRFAFFLDQNKITVKDLIKRLSNEETMIPIAKFTDFLKAKIEKRKQYHDLFCQSQLIDVDKDGYISEDDLLTCLRNLNSTSFYKNNGQALASSTFNSSHKSFVGQKEIKLNDLKIIQVCKQIRDALLLKKQSLLALWQQIDKNNSGLINLSSFIKGVNQTIIIASTILEKLFTLMDKNEIGLVDYEKFSTVLNIETQNQIPKPMMVKDDFSWQESIIKKLRQWASAKKFNSAEAFKWFDSDLNGSISKSVMKKGLSEHLEVPKSEITDTRIDRLFKLMSFYKTDSIEQSDFDRLFEDANPYQHAATGSTSTKFASTMRGGLASTSTFDWKYAAIQQIGLTISKTFESITESFMAASEKKTSVNFPKFKAFVEKHHALIGFNMTSQLLQQIFAELDPHKKAFLTLKDWNNCFYVFNKSDTQMIEFKNFMQSKFVSVSSAFNFFLQFEQTSNIISFEAFDKGVAFIFGNQRKVDAYKLFKVIANKNESFTKDEFKNEFSNVEFKGSSVLNTKEIKGSLQQRARSQTDKLTSNINASSMNENQILDKVKVLIKQSGKSFETVFRQFDSDKSGTIGKDEFLRAMKVFNLGLTDVEITKLLDRLDNNSNGTLNYTEFVRKLRDNNTDFQKRMQKRAVQRLQKLKQNMIYHMVSPHEAFNMFDSTDTKTLSYNDFYKLISQLFKLANEELPNYTVIKDLFETIDTKGDQIIDLAEWNTAFNIFTSSTSHANITTVPLASWESSYEAVQYASCIAKNRKLLNAHFQQIAAKDHNGESKFVTFNQVKTAVEPLFQKSLQQGLSDQKLEQLIQVAQALQQIGLSPETKVYDYTKLLNVLRNRHLGPQFKQAQIQ